MAQKQPFRLLTCHCLNVQLHQHLSSNQTMVIPQEQYPSEFVDLLEHQHQHQQQQQQKSNGGNQKELDNFLLNCKLIKIVPNGIKINYEYLCLKRMADDYHQLQITFCAVCEKETHAVFVKTTRNVHFSNGDGDDDDDSSPQSFALVSNQLLNDEKKIHELKCDLNYSPALGIVMPERLVYSDLNEMKSDSGIGKTFINNYDNSYFLISSYIQSDIQEKIKNFLKQEKTLMQERIKRFTSEQEQIYKELCQITQDNRNSFLKMIEAIKIRHNIDNDSMDKENLNYQESSTSLLKNKTIANGENKNVNKNFEIDVYHHHHLEDVQNVSADDFVINTSKTITPTMEKSPEELDCLFEMDDIDQSHHHHHHHHVHFGLMDFSAGQSKGSMFQNDANDVGGDGHDGQPNDDTDTEEADDEQQDDNVVDVDEDVDLEERRDVFPLQESNSYSHVNNNQRLSMDASFSLNALPSSSLINDHHYQRQKKSSSSMVVTQQHQQQQPKNFYINSGNSGNNNNNKNHRKSQQIASSLPIQIPHFARRSSRELEESFRINPGESIADSIQKLARSVRNQNNILDDRPSRCLNTVDLIKSRPFFN